MKRTQIYLSDDLYFELKNRSKRSISETIRQILRENLMPNKKEKILSSIDEAFGLWQDRKFDTETYIRNIRKGTRLDNFRY
ncbi:ribbon-helix-helix protein, CopG family [Candidatus Desulfofervidus auxilii]|uniref:Ribbon-helix-helix protein, CopG family n=1 Tax=Desulfofervidus auxilii TaxID=1621989 RepID=A0A7U4TFZ9_DESA2|nr:CopG family transcriptional regulator [Candidatus Desulfofervidus auxilii]AMM39914.1 ribbon-helix-helix protein, CopG family [Candidatus Desulfofervidus auxilii]CAD7769324.1 hypothetical protein BLFGPEAP_00130 [Candidatus Methanoperedenaceae archaeon GB50]CAD7770266.1 hypothetical protein DMNBHIDG_00148 [Candidatus Methanoperedenaceae archaeon GB37]